MAMLEVKEMVVVAEVEVMGVMGCWGDGRRATLTLQTYTPELPGVNNINISDLGKISKLIIPATLQFVIDLQMMEN